MPNNLNSLPEYPCLSDMWDELKRETRPILVYGMGNGADKLYLRLEKYGITPTDIFASDGFVRGHSFRGVRVKSFSEVKELYDEFVIVLSFASSRREVLDMLYAMDEKYDMYVPDMPVSGEEYFDREFFNSNYSAILAARSALADEESRNLYNSIICYKISGRMKYLRDAFSPVADKYSLLPTEKIQGIIDAGAYNGDTLREAAEYLPRLSSAIAVEPDRRNFKKLLSYAESADFEIQAQNAAVWSEVGEGELASGGNRNSSISSTVSYKHTDEAVRLLSIDSLGYAPDYIKYDVEGVESEALIGSDEVIRNSRPALRVSVYHRSRDIFGIINYIWEKYPFYKLYLRRTECLPAWEIDVLAIADNP